MSNPTGKGGFQERKHQINRNGRPKDFAGLRKLALQMARNRATSSKGDPILIDGRPVTNVEALLLAMLHSKDPRLQLAFMKIAYGEEPQRHEVDLTAMVKGYVGISPDDWNDKTE